MFTCISCRVAFENAAEQRSHFATDWHRYNMKRRVANLPPVAAENFNEKVIERREQNAVKTDPRSLVCAACNKTFSSENAYRSHVMSKRHRDREHAHASSSTDMGTGDHLLPRSSGLTQLSPSISPKGTPLDPPRDEDSLVLQANGTHELRPAIDEEDIDEEDIDEEGADLDRRIAGFRRRLQPTDCLFCTQHLSSPDDNVSHMAKVHSFFIPDRDILLDLSGLLSYLGEKVATGNLCLFCPHGGREFGSLEAVRKHMRDKAHCKLAYATDEDRAELADYYDFEGIFSEGEDSEWEDLDEGENALSEMSNSQIVPHSRLPTLASDGLGLVLPSGRTIGHRSLRVYYAQHLRPVGPQSNSDSKALKLAEVRQRLADPTLALVPAAGGHGAYGRGLEMIKARNAGEAKWARKQGNSFRDQKKLDNLRTKVGFVHNNQKHFRDPLLQ